VSFLFRVAGRYAKSPLCSLVQIPVLLGLHD
jgi:hypothetical protein